MTGKTPSADSRIPRGPHADSSPFALARRPPSVPKRERPAELWPPLAAASGRPVAGSPCGLEGTHRAKKWMMRVDLDCPPHKGSMSDSLSDGGGWNLSL